MKIAINKLGRLAWKKAKTDHRESNPTIPIGEFWKSFGDANNMKVIIDRYEHGLPVIQELEFNDEKSYVWFSLRWQ